jgi:hypothetical protein
VSEHEAPLLTGAVGSASASAVVARSFSIWGRELPVLLALALVVHAPRVACAELLEWIWPDPPPDRFEVNRWLRDMAQIWLTRSLLDGLFWSLSVALVIFAVYARLQGRTARVAECVRGGLRRVLPVLRVSVCLLLAETVMLCGAMLVLWSMSSWGSSTAFWFLLYWADLWIPLMIAVLLSPFWVAAVPAAVVEKPGKLLRRSWSLTRGHRFAVCAIVLLLFAIDWASVRLIVQEVPEDVPSLAWKCIWWTQELLMVSLGAVFAAVGYHALRLEKEGVDVSDLEKVFA